MENLNKLNKTELENLLKKLKLYNTLKRQLWNRAKQEFDKIINWKQVYKVEYFEWISKQEALNEAIKIYKKIFDINIDEKSIIMKENKELNWGIRVFKNDNMIDLSYRRIENFFRK